MSELEQRVKDAAEKATRRAWSENGMTVVCENGVIAEIPSPRVNGVFQCSDNKVYIALASPTNILTLLAEKDAEIERLTRERDEWKRKCEAYIAERVRDARNARNAAYDALVKGE